MERPRRIGMPWYRAEDYARLRALMQDADRLPTSHEAWRVSAEQVEGEVTRSGVAVVRVVVEPDEFAAWCNERGLRADGAARARFANEKAEGLRRLMDP
ncbi:hypothetical protein [Methylobacterium sp. WSM2598]|uniref:hypothetical protein n=1 Tax=Methylobacterium sp. WSM2598 TaxID=398261 RepID=UPI0003679A83|nr:hypothetical protein [Methylobacterium sp. WSM2598]